MLVNKVVETPEGIIQFNGELSQAEADLVVKTGLNYLLSVGLLKANLADTDEPQQLND